MQITKKGKISIVSVIIIISVILIYAIKQPNTEKLEKEYISVSWCYNYGSIEEMTNTSDVIALIKVKKLVELDNNGGGPYSTFEVEVIDPIYNCQKGEKFNIYMTGGEKNGKLVEIKDDPLLEKNQEFVIFALKNPDGTYRILSGSQGRLYYQNGKVNSLHNKAEVFTSFASKNSPMGNPDDYSINVKEQDFTNLKEEIKGYLE